MSSAPRTSAPASAAALELGTIAYRDAEPLATGNEEPAGVDGGWRHDFAALLGSEPLQARRRSPNPGAGRDLLHLGEHRPRQRGHHSRETLRWMIGAAAAAFELDASDTSFSRLLDVPHRLLSMGALDALGRWQGRGGARSTDNPRVAAAVTRAAADDPRDDPGGAVGTRSRPRSAARRLLLVAAVPGRRRQGLDRAADRVRRNGGLPDRRGIRDDRGRVGDDESALG